MTRDQLQQKTSRGETFAELLRRAYSEWQPPESVAAALAETEKARSAEGKPCRYSTDSTACNPEAVNRAMADDGDNLDDVKIPRGKNS